MTVFSKLKNMNDKEIQAWLTKVGRANVIALGIGLLGADNDVKNRVFSNMSKKAVDMLKQDIEKYARNNYSESDISANAAKLENMF